VRRFVKHFYTCKFYICKTFFSHLVCPDSWNILRL
jgi:hypothetical protein